MNKRKILGIGTVVTAFLFSIVAVTVAYAALNETLKINGSATATGANRLDGTERWKIVFTDLKEATVGNTHSDYPSAKETSRPEIIGDTTIETYKVELKKPGDWIAYNFKISNTGDIPAKIDTSFAMPTPTCTKGTSGVDADRTLVCGNLEYTLKYVDGTDAGRAVAKGDLFAAGESKEVQLKLYYKGEITKLPVDDVSVGNLGIIIPFIQA